MPGGVGDHADGVGQHDHFLYAGLAVDGGVGAQRLASENGAVNDGAVEHAGTAHVDAVLSLASQFRGNVYARQRLADVTEVLGVLERRFLRDRKLGGGGSEGAVRGTTPGILVNDEARLGGASRSGNVPLLRGGGDEHGAAGGGGVAEARPTGANGGAAAGTLEAILRVEHGTRDFDMLPVGVELVGEDHREAGVRALAELRLRDPEGDAVIGRDLEPGIGLEGGGAFVGIRVGQVEGDDQAGAGQGRGLEEFAAIEALGIGFHRTPPLAARTTAASRRG